MQDKVTCPKCSSESVRQLSGKVGVGYATEKGDINSDPRHQFVCKCGLVFLWPISEDQHEEYINK